MLFVKKYLLVIKRNLEDEFYNNITQYKEKHKEISNLIVERKNSENQFLKNENLELEKKLKQAFIENNSNKAKLKLIG